MLNPNALTAEEVARILRVGKGSVYRLARTGELPSYHVGRKLRFSARDVSAYMTAANEPREASFSSSGKTACGVPAPEAAFPLDGREAFVIVGGGLEGAIAAEMLGEAGFPVSHARSDSYTALVNLYAGHADAAIVSLYDRKTNSHNAAYIRRIAPGTPILLVRLHRTRQGLMVAPGNPKGLRTWGSLLKDGVRLANRKRGSSARVLLDEKLSALEANPEVVLGYGRELETGVASAQEVACGAADVAVGSDREAEEAGLGFVPLQDGWVDIALIKTERTAPFVRAVKEMAAGDAFAKRLSANGFDASRAGSIVYEC